MRLSAPFFDTSYKPPYFYNWDRALGGQPDEWYRLDLQGGVQHESNGKDRPGFLESKAHSDFFRAGFALYR